MRAENLYPFRMSSSDELNGTSMSNRCYDHSINNTHSNSHSNSQSQSQSHSLNLSQSQKQQSTSGKKPTPSMASSKCSTANIRHGDRPVLEINCDLANDSQPQLHNQSHLVGDSEGRMHTSSNSNSNSNGLSESGNSAVPTLPLSLAPLVQPQPHYRIPTLPLHIYNNSNNSGGGNSPEENLHLEAQQGGFQGTSTCCELDDQFKEMQLKREECTKRNERVFVSEANAEVLKKILIVDDSVLCQKIIIKVLDGANYSFETAGNGREACEKICE